MKKFFAAVTLLIATFFTGCAMPAQGTGAEAEGQQGSLLLYIGVMVLFFAAMYFIAIRPEKKRQKEQQKMLDSLRTGDTVLTTSGFYGTVIDITDDTVIVEFGNNKNCRIPMQRAAIVQLEHPENAAPVSTPVSDSPEVK